MSSARPPQRRATASAIAAVGLVGLFCEKDVGRTFTSSVARPSQVATPSTAHSAAGSERVPTPAPVGGNSSLVVPLTAIAAACQVMRSRSRRVVLRAAPKESTTTVVEVDTPETSEVQGEVAEQVVSLGGVATASVPSEPSFSWDLAVRRMWTAADKAHIHAITGTIHISIGLVYIIDVIAGDVATLNGMKWTPHVSLDVLLISMLFGAANAVSGLQRSLLPKPFKDLVECLGFGEKPNYKSAGFINTAVFYFILSYQSLRVLPDYPVWMMPLDPVIAFGTLVAVWHSIYIINSYVGQGLSQGLAFGISAPLLLNVPVALHLLFQGESWVQSLGAAYPGWPEVFFGANYALAWAGSMVTFVLSLYERRVVTLTERLILILLMGLITAIFVPLRAYVLVPDWFFKDAIVMLTLSPP